MAEGLISTRLLIGGSAVPAEGSATFPVRSPATGEVVGHAADASAADLDRAVADSATAFRGWSSQTAWAREAAMRGAAAHARSQAGEIGMLMALEMGKPRAQAEAEVTSSCDLIDYYAAEAVRIEGEVHPTEKPGLHSWVTYHPLGVCAAITPWNYPVALVAWKLGPALAAGCTVVVKPSPVAPLSATAFCLALCEGGLPPGVVNAITAAGPEAGADLISHPLVAKVAMTGSTAVGKAILAACAPSLKPATLELGGHCPAVVCADADMANAASTVAYKAFRNTGQSCSSVNRVYVTRAVHDEFVGLLAAAARALTVGDGATDPATEVGPLATADGLARVERHVADALAKGASLVCGGKPPEGAAFSRGHFYLPTVLTGATPDMLAMREETFGPLAPVRAFDDLDVALSEANDTPYGLAAYVFASDAATIAKATAALQSGTVCVNHGAVNTAYGPYEGWGDSGYGLELSRKAVFEYLKAKHVKVAL
jgi:succinate-semialdehyde dehydrogenase/glutarate-semialdehyde dehydrogenase